MKLLVSDGAELQPKDRLGLTPIDRANGKQPRLFLEPEHEKKTDTVALLKGYIVAATGQPPIEFTGTLNAQSRGTGAAQGGGLGGNGGGGAQPGAKAPAAPAQQGAGQGAGAKPKDAQAASDRAPNTAQVIN